MSISVRHNFSRRFYVTSLARKPRTSLMDRLFTPPHYGFKAAYRMECLNRLSYA